MTRAQVGDRVRIKDVHPGWTDGMKARIDSEGLAVLDAGASGIGSPDDALLIEFDSDKARRWVGWRWLEKV